MLAATGVIELTVLGQNVNSYGRDITRRRPLFAELLRALGRSRASSGSASPARTPRTCVPRRSPRWPRPRRSVRSLHLPSAVTVRTGCSRPCVAATRSSVTWSDCAGARGHRRPRGHDRLHRGFSGRDRRRVRRDCWPRSSVAPFDSAYTFIFSAREGTRAASMTDQFIADDVIKERFERLKTGPRPLGVAQTRGPGWPLEEVAGRRSVTAQ